MSLGWKIFVFVIVAGSFIGHFVFLTWTSRYRLTDKPGEDTTTGHVWDDDLTELNKPLPRWWLYLFHATVVFGMLYLVLYPGSGIFEGVLGWSQEDQYREEMSEAQARYGELFQELAAQDIPTLATDPRALSAGFNLFGNNCAQCHGSDARGSPGFPNLADDAWQWGSEPQHIETSIRDGRTGVMPPWGAALGGASEVDRVAQFVLQLGGLEHDAEQASQGAQKFAMFCTSCHGPEGKGIPALGAPDLTDSAWLYAPTLDSVRKTIEEGRSGQMPAFADTLGAERVKVLAAYVYSLSLGSEK